MKIATHADTKACLWWLNLLKEFPNAGITFENVRVFLAIEHSIKFIDNPDYAGYMLEGSDEAISFFLLKWS